MFRSLKEKLKVFRKKAIKELEAAETGGIETKNNIKTTVTTGSTRTTSSPGSPAITDPTARPRSGKTVDDHSILEPPRKKKGSPKPRPKIERKRSRRGQGASLKRIIESETQDQVPWAEAKKKQIVDSEDTGWFAKIIPENRMEAILWDLEVALLESDVALPVVEEVKTLLKRELMGKKVKRGSDLDSVIESALRNAVFNVLSTKTIHFDKFVEKGKKPVKLMFVGVNGTGKTSAIAKLAFRLKKQKKTCIIAAGDTFRAGAIEQLERHASKLGIKLIKDKAGSDPAAIAYDSIEHAKARHKDVVLIDTAGRMQTNKNLMDEMRKIKRVAEPDMIIFVGDALAGNDVV